MAILILAITLFVRLFSPHTIFPFLIGLPIVPGLTGLTGLATVISFVRRTVSIRPPLFIILQWSMLAWCVLTLLMNAVGFKGILAIKFINDMFFCTLVALVVDRLVRWKILLATYLMALTLIAIFATPQIWSPRLCAEITGDLFDDIIWDTRPCTGDRMCENSPPPRPGAPAVRNFRCERRGPLNVSSLLGRARWVSVFTDPNTLSSMCATVAPMLLAWAFTFKRRRVLKSALVAGTLLILSAGVFATGSRGSLLGLLIGIGFVLWRFLGNKVLVIGLLMVIVLAAQMTLSDKKLVQRGDEDDLTGAAESNKWRTAAMEVGFRLWRQYPIFGIGHNEIFKHHVLEAHNGYISAASEVGTPGLFLMVFILWLNFRFAVAAGAEAVRRGLHDIKRFSVGVIAGLIAGTLCFTVFLTNYASFHTLTMSMLSGGLFRSVQKEDPTIRLNLSYWDVIAAATLAAIVMGVTYLALNAYFTMSGFPFENDTRSGSFGH